MKSTSILRSRLLLVDTCVILEAYLLEIWHTLVNECRIAVPKTVVDETVQEGRHYDEFDVDLENQIATDQIESPSLDAPDLQIVRNTCGPKFTGEIHDGELECLACLLEDQSGNSIICSSDAVVSRYLGWIQKPDQGISLEEILNKLGIRRGLKLAPKLTKSFREKYTAQGFQEALQKGFLKL